MKYYHVVSIACLMPAALATLAVGFVELRKAYWRWRLNRARARNRRMERCEAFLRVKGKWIEEKGARE